jgi:hypothetical protein
MTTPAALATVSVPASRLDHIGGKIRHYATLSIRVYYFDLAAKRILSRPSFGRLLHLAGASICLLLQTIGRQKYDLFPTTLRGNLSSVVMPKSSPGIELAAMPTSRAVTRGVADHQGSLDRTTLGARESAEFVARWTSRNPAQDRADLAVLAARAHL